MPLVPGAMVDASEPLPSIVMAFVIVTLPNVAGSSAPISPPAAVFEIAPAHVRQGAVRLHGFASSPTPEIHVCVACAEARPGASTAIRPAATGVARVTWRFV